MILLVFRIVLPNEGIGGPGSECSCQCYVVKTLKRESVCSLGRSSEGDCENSVDFAHLFLLPLASRLDSEGVLLVERLVGEFFETAHGGSVKGPKLEGVLAKFRGDEGVDFARSRRVERFGEDRLRNHSEGLNEANDHIELTSIVFGFSEEVLNEPVVERLLTRSFHQLEGQKRAGSRESTYSIGKIKSLLEEVVGLGKRVDEEKVRFRKFEFLEVILLHHLRERAMRISRRARHDSERPSHCLLRFGRDWSWPREKKTMALVSLRVQGRRRSFRKASSGLIVSGWSLALLLAII